MSRAKVVLSTLLGVLLSLAATASVLADGTGGWNPR